MLVGTAYERMGIGQAPKKIAAKPLLSLILEALGHIPAEDESFIYSDMEITAKTIVDGRLTEVIVHILDEDDLAEINAANSDEEVTA